MALNKALGLRFIGTSSRNARRACHRRHSKNEYPRLCASREFATCASHDILHCLLHCKRRAGQQRHGRGLTTETDMDHGATLVM